MLVAAENSPIAPMNSSTGMPLSSWTFLKASSDICGRFGDAAWAPACAYPGRPHAGDKTAARSACLFEGLAEAAAARMDIPVTPLINATPANHATVAPAATSLMRLDPICMLSPSSFLHREPNPPSGGADTEPEQQRHDGDELQPERLDATLGQRDFSSHREGEDHRERERCHLHPERVAVITLDRLRREQQHAGHEHHDQAADEPRLRVARDARDRLIAEAEPEQPQIEHQHGAADHGEREQMPRLDHGKRPRRLADRLADRRRLHPLKEREQVHHGAPSGGTTHPATALTMRGCGCLSQSNQLYAMNRPQTTMIVQRTSDRAPARRTARGGTGSVSHSSMRRSTPRWNTNAFRPASTSATAFIRNQML